MAELPGFLSNLGYVDETVQRIDGVMVMDAKAIYDSTYGGIWTSCAKTQLERCYGDGCVWSAKKWSVRENVDNKVNNP